MPALIPRGCRKHGCRNTTTDRSGYCDEHRNTGWENHQQGNDATVELSPVAGRNVLGVRDGIIRDQTALRTLQEYIRTQCLR